MSLFNHKGTRSATQRNTKDASNWVISFVSFVISFVPFVVKKAIIKNYIN
jgi:hypothetical protein